MLSVAKVKLHGMKDDRWVLQDKLTTYKGLIQLYSRDRKILEFDQAVLRRKTHKELLDIQYDIAKKREQFGNLLKGDRQQLRNQLQEHKELQLKYQNFHPKDAFERISQDTFSKRKELDMLKYKMKQTTKRLTDAKLYRSVLEDRIKYADLEVFPCEKQAEIITGKVQDAILKKEAALVVHQTYKDILNMMKKDAVYFDAVLKAVQKDGMVQGNCLIRTAEVGQLAMEYLDDRREEYKQLEITVKRDMKIRLNSLAIVHEHEEQMNKEMRCIIRRDSDVNLCNQKVQPLDGEEDLLKDMHMIENKLNFLKHITKVPDIRQIFNCMAEQQEQKQRLNEFVQRLSSERDTLQNGHNHAQLLLQSMENSVAENTFVNMELKKEVQKMIDQQCERKRKTLQKIEYRNELLGKIRSSLFQLDNICKIIINKPEQPLKVQPEGSIYLVPAPEQLQHDMTSILERIFKKLTILNQNYVEQKGEEYFNRAQDEFRGFVQRVCKNVTAMYGVTIQGEKSLTDDVSREDPEVPSRAEIKLRSDKIVEICSKSEFDTPEPENK